MTRVAAGKESLKCFCLYLQDFNIQGTKLISCGMDHSLKIWSVDTDKIRLSIEESYVYNQAKSKK